MTDPEFKSVSFIGLGAMGAPMCANLSLKSPVPVMAYDLKSAAVEAAVTKGAHAVQSIEQATEADLVFICVPGEQEMLSVCLGEEGIVNSVREGQVIVDCTTTTVSASRAVASALKAKGASFADAPVARGVPNAIAGTLSVTVGGDEEIFSRIEPWLRHMATDVAYCGPVGTGTVMKLMNNMVLFENVSALAEAMAVATRAGVDRERVFELLGQGSADSFALRRHGTFMTSGEYPTDQFPISYSVKDLDYALALAQDVGVETEGARLTRDRFQRIVDQGMGHLYSPVVYELFNDS